MPISKPEHVISSRERLGLAAQMIRVLDGRRQISGSAHLGSNIERMIIQRELDELESEILQHPGALGPHLASPSPHRPTPSSGE